MPANRMNYIVVYDGESQIYGSGSKDVALETPPPDGLTLESKHVFYITQKPEDGEIVLHEVPQEEVLSAELKVRKTKKKDDEQQQQE